MRRRIRWHAKEKSKSKSKSKFKSAVSADEQLMLLGEPQLLPGEDAAAYDQFLAHFCEAVKPVDIIEKIFVADVTALEWEVLRWRRLKASLMRTRGLNALEDFLETNLPTNNTRTTLRPTLRKSLKTICRKTRRILRGR